MRQALMHVSATIASAWIRQMGQGTCATARKGTKATHTFLTDTMVIIVLKIYNIFVQYLVSKLYAYHFTFAHLTTDDECKYSPCPSGGVYHNTLGGYRCSCRVGLKFSEQSNSCGPNINLIIGN